MYIAVVSYAWCHVCGGVLKKVSIITATYNSAETILDTVRSVECQTYPNIEYIIIDGDSKDLTLELIKTTSSRVATIVSEPDLGIYDALNKGLALASGDIIGFLHSDDLLAYPDAIKDIVQSMESSGSNAVYADLKYVDRDNTQKTFRHWVSGTFNLSKLKWGWMPPHPTLYLGSTVYQSVGGFDLSYKICADYDFILRCFRNPLVRVSYLPAVTVLMRVGGASNNSISNITKKIKEEILLLKKNGQFWPIVVLFKRLSKIGQLFGS